ncbi:MAG: hypothetical protein OXF98_11370 [Rhodospirillaceae bacterium]|nr:hypothetical protein [Rhodospirillaceae bacterium]
MRRDRVSGSRVNPRRFNAVIIRGLASFAAMRGGAVLTGPSLARSRCRFSSDTVLGVGTSVDDMTVRTPHGGLPSRRWTAQDAPLPRQRRVGAQALLAQGGLSD